jgi:hypothetical protein
MTGRLEDFAAGTGAGDQRAAARAVGDLPMIRCEGEYWTIVYEGGVLRLRDGKGIRYLAHLLLRPGERVAAHVLQAAADGDGSATAADALALERVRSAVSKRIKDAVARIRRHHPTLGLYLVATVKTGRDCVYRPDPGQDIRWVQG